MPESESYALAKEIAEYCLSKKAHDVKLMNLQDLSSVTDFFVVCHADSDVQVKAIADAVMEGTRQKGVKPWHREGYEHLNWVLLDYVDVVVHIFQEELRAFYGLERLWGDAELETIEDA